MADQNERTPWGDISHLTESGSSFPFPWQARTYLPEGEDPHTTLSGEHEVWSADGQTVAEVDARQVADMIAAVGDLYEALRRLYQNDPMDSGKMTAAAAALRKAEGREGGGDGTL